MRARRHCHPVEVGSSAFAGYRFPSDVILLAVRWYLRFGLSYRDLEEPLVGRGIEVDHVTLYRGVQHFTPLVAEAAGPCRHTAGMRWFVDETYVKVAGVWRYVYRVVDEHGQVIDVLVSARRDIAAEHEGSLSGCSQSKKTREEVTTDRAPALAGVIADLFPAAVHDTEQYANNWMESDHGSLKARLRPMGGLKLFRSARTIIGGHAFIQNLRRGHYELGLEARRSSPNAWCTSCRFPTVSHQPELISS